MGVVFGLLDRPLCTGLEEASFPGQGGVDLGLHTSGCRISWFDQRGMTWKQFTPAVGSYLDRHPSPGMILIQVGSNDLGSTKGFELVHDIECDLLRLRVLLPDVKIVWSELLQRRYWHTAREGKAMEKTRKRVNLAVKNIVLGVGGYVIKHNNIRARDINLFRNDGTHLSDIGINVYLNTIQGALESFLSSNGPRVFPLQ